jgi:hypothetical protein
MRRSKLLFVSALVIAACDDREISDDPDPSEVDHTGEKTQPVTCQPRLDYYPVRGRHNNGYDQTCNTPNVWGCNAEHSNSDYGGGHYGNDIWAARGTPVVATVSGRAALVGFTHDSGNKVTIIDACGWYHFSTHLDSIAPGISNGVHVPAGTVIGYVGNSGTLSNGVVHLHYSIYPDGNYYSGIDPHPYLRAVESNVCGGGSPPPPPPPPSGNRFWVDTFGYANGYTVPGVDPINGWLNPGLNYVYCKVLGPRVGNDTTYNRYWLKTDLDTSNNNRPTIGQFISAYQLSRWGNDEAKDNSGAVIPDCAGAPPPPPPTTKYWVDTFANATGYSSPGGTPTGTLNRGTNYVFCKKWGPEVRVGNAFNHYWMLTDLDTGPAKQYVSAYYLTRWGNDEARDNSGAVLPNCP